MHNGSAAGPDGMGSCAALPEGERRARRVEAEERERRRQHRADQPHHARRDADCEDLVGARTLARRLCLCRCSVAQRLSRNAQCSGPIGAERSVRVRVAAARWRDKTVAACHAQPGRSVRSSRYPMVLAILSVLAVRALTGAARVRVAVAHNLDVDPAGGGRCRARDLSAQHNPVGAARPQDLHSIACSTVGSASNAGAVEQEVTTQRRGQPDLRSEMRMRDAAREHA